MMADLIAEIAPTLKARTDRFILVTMAAGIKISDFYSMIGYAYPIIRIMPNTPAAVGSGVSMLLKAGQEKQLSLEVELPEKVEAPVEEGQTIGMVRVLLAGQVIAKVPAVAARSVGMPGLVEGFLRVFGNWR